MDPGDPPIASCGLRVGRADFLTGGWLARDTAASYGLGARLRYGWTGREWDAETGLSYHWARYFDPGSRRWTQEDPIGYGGGGNLYAYAGGSPLEARDPSGLIPSDGEVRRRQEMAMVDPMAAQMINLATRVDVYNFWLPAFDPWGIDYYYDLNGKLVGRLANFHGRSNHYLKVPGEADRQLDYGLVPLDGGYEIEEDPDAWEEAAREAASDRVTEMGVCDRACFERNSPEGRWCDFKSHHLFPRNRLWNGGNGTYYHFDVVANTAWAMAGRHYSFTCPELLAGAHWYHIRRDRRLDASWDQYGIRRGC